MGATKKPRKAYRPKLTALNTVQRSIEAASLIPRDAVDRVTAGVMHAFDGLRRGVQPDLAWRVLADALNVAETLAGIGICSDAGSVELIFDGQQVLASLAERHISAGSWAMRGGEMQVLQDALERHTIQLQHATMGEYERAISRTKARLSQALAGNAAADVIVVGDITR